MNTLSDILSRDRKALIKAWLEKALQNYLPKTSELFKKQKDPFANPVGATLSRTLEGIFDQLLLDQSTEELQTHVQDLVQVRAVQDFTPSGAVSFMLDLKRIVRRRCAKEGSGDLLEPALVEFEERIDLLCMLVFDMYMEQREKIWKLRSQELQQRTSYLLRKKAGIKAMGDD